jgi:hypothetical protein
LGNKVRKNEPNQPKRVINPPSDVGKKNYIRGGLYARRKCTDILKMEASVGTSPAYCHRKIMLHNSCGVSSGDARSCVEKFPQVGGNHQVQSLR